MDHNESLVRSLITEGVLRTPRIIAAFRAIDRIHFVPPELRAEAYRDCPLPILAGQTISQPRTVAFLLELLDPQPGHQVLDVGTGSGWTVTLLAHIVGGGGGRVLGLERIPELCAFGKSNVSVYNFVSRDIAVMQCADATQEIAKSGPFDRILSGAAAARGIPDAWKDALKPGGRIVAPVADAVWCFEKILNGTWRERTFPGFAFVPLVSEQS